MDCQWKNPKYQAQEMWNILFDIIWEDAAEMLTFDSIIMLVSEDDVKAWSMDGDKYPTWRLLSESRSEIR